MRRKTSKTYLDKENYYPGLNMFWKPNFATDNQIPIVTATQYIPESLLTYSSFTKSQHLSYCERFPERKITVNFFTDDYRFGLAWIKPRKMTEKLRAFHSTLAPDFTLSFDFPEIMNRWNHYRKMWVTAYWQSEGLTVIPVANWLDKSSYEWCFEGMPMNSTIAISTNEISTVDEFNCFNDGFTEMIHRLSPSQVLCYGTRWMRKMLNMNFNTRIIFYRSRNGWTQTNQN
jgi:Domain of unknown function (DUF4417)